MTLRTCIECGEPCTSTYCEEHKPKDSRPRPSRSRGYDSAWDRLSRRARRLQPFCTDCGTTEDLTTDHLPQAWDRKAAGLPIRLEDVAVVCRSCNSKRGAARGPGGRGQGRPEGADGRSQSLNENPPGGIR